MSERGQRAQATPLARMRALHVDWGRVLLVSLLVVGAVLFLHRAFQFFMYDDEGGYAYASWRISLGEVPYRDYLTPQMPGFLYWGGLLVRLFGRSFVALRLPTMAAMLLAAGLVYAIGRELHDRAIALAALGFFLADPNVFHNARFFRPEAYMLLWNAAGIYCLVLSEKRGRLRYTWLASLFFGLAIITKLFGFLSLAGCFLYLLYAWWRERRPWRSVLLQGLALGLPAVALVGAVGAVFYHITPYFLVAVFEHHTMQGAGMPVAQEVLKTLAFYKSSFLFQPLLALLALLGAATQRRGKALPSIMFWQLPTMLSFFALTRSLMSRHLTYLAPAVACLAAVAVVQLLRGRWRLWRLRQSWQISLLALALVYGALWPAARLDAVGAGQKDREILKLAAWIQGQTQLDQAVMCDYPGINFLAGRRSTYWAAGISGGAAQSGQIRGASLQREVEQEKVPLVIINTLYGAHQMTEMVDYPDFRRYVQSHFALVDKFQSVRQQMEVYSRDDTIPLQPGIRYGGQLELTGLRVPHVVPSGTTVALETRWQALAPMADSYHVSLRLVDATGHFWAQMDEPLMEQFSHLEPGVPWDIIERYRTSSWQPGQVVLQKHRLKVPSAVPPGTYYLAVKVYDLQTGFSLPEAGGQGIVLADGGRAVTTLRVAAGNKVPAVANLPIATSLQAPMAEGLVLLGSGPVPARVRADRSLALDLFWQSPSRPVQDYHLEFRLLRGAQVLQRWPAEVSEGYPTSSWRDGEIALGSYSLPLSERIAEGHASLEVVALTADGREAGPPQTVAADILVEPRPDLATIRQRISRPLTGVTFAGRIGLLGYDLSTTQLRPGETLALTLYWECLQPVEGEYKVFTHLLDSASQVQGQADAIPDEGRAPTSGWRPGDVLADRYEIPLAPTAPMGTLQLEIGFYDPLSGQRLPVVHDGQPSTEDRVILPTTITVR